MTIGILGAMQEEVDDLLPHLQNRSTQELGSRKYHCGTLANHQVVVALSRIGKVAAASTVTTLIDHFKARMIIFTGVAGAIAPHLGIGDVVVAHRLMQHDMDGSSIMGLRRFEIPLLNRIDFETTPQLRALAVAAARGFLAIDKRHRGASVYEGTIASGDQFVVGHQTRACLAEAIPGLMAVEMEGGAVAQVCHEWSIPFVVIRSISDNADQHAPKNFTEFLRELAAPLSAGVVLTMLRELPPAATFQGKTI